MHHCQSDPMDMGCDSSPYTGQRNRGKTSTKEAKEEGGDIGVSW